MLCNVSLLMFLFVIIAKLFLIARAAARVAFVVFSHSILFRLGYMKRYTLSLTSGLRFVIILLPASFCGIFETNIT